MDKKILVVEDEGITSMELQRKLKFWGYKISSIAFSKKEAIKEVQNRIPDLILMDVALKGNGDGIDAGKEIKNLFDIPIIYITAYDDEKTRKRAEETNPSGYMVKPVNDNDLQQTIKSVLEENEQENKLIITGKWMDKNLINPDLSVISIDSNGYIKFMNKSAEDLIGKKSSPELGIDLMDVFEFNNEDNTEIPVKNIINANSPSITNNVNIITNEGDEVPVEFITNPILEDSGEFIGAVILFRNSSDHIKQESDLKLYKNLYKNSTIAIGLYNQQGKILDANETLMELFGVHDKAYLENIPILPQSKLDEENVTSYQLKLDLKGYKKLNSYETAPSGIIYLKASLTPLLSDRENSDVVYILQLQDLTLQHLKEEALTERREDNLKLQRTNEDLNEVIRNQQIDQGKLNDELNDLKKEIELNQSNFSAKERKLTEEIESMKESLTQNQKKYSELQSTNTELSDQIKIEQTEQNKLNNKLIGLKNELVLNKSNFESKERELIEKLEFTEESRSQLEKKYENSLENIETVKVDIHNLENELSVAKSDLAAEREKYSEYKNSTHGLINNLQHENQTQKNNIIKIKDELSTEIAKNREQEEELRKKIESLNDDVQEKKTELDHVKESSRVETEKNRRIVDEKEDLINRKDLLLKNFQDQFKKDIRMISGLNGLQSQYFQEQMVNNLREGQNMIKSIMLMHEKLYESDDLEKINFKEHVSRIVRDLSLSYNIDTSQIDVKVNIEDLCLDIDKATIISLIINEIVSNSFKYAFTPDKSGKLSVQVWNENHELILDIADNGIGLPNNINIESTDTLGLQLIRMLVNQIDGNIKYKTDNGAHFVIKFPN